MNLVRRSVSRLSLGVLAVALTLPLAACENVLTGLRVALAGGAPLVQFLVDRGDLTRERADDITRDFNDSVDVAARLKTAIEAAKGNQGEQLKAASAAYSEFKAIYARGHFGKNERILLVANLIDGVFASVVRFYGGAQPGLLQDARTPKDLERELKQRMEEIKREMNRRDQSEVRGPQSEVGANRQDAKTLRFEITPTVTGCSGTVAGCAGGRVFSLRF